MISLTALTLIHVCACPKPESRFKSAFVAVINVFEVFCVTAVIFLSIIARFQDRFEMILLSEYLYVYAPTLSFRN
jgi:hypothetical protein